MKNKKITESQKNAKHFNANKIIEHPNGITEEVNFDGDRSFTGPGGGVLNLFGDKSASLSPKLRKNSNKIDLLIAIGDMMPKRSIRIEDILDYKGESQIMLEALRSKNAQFFRDLGDAIKPGPYLIQKKYDSNMNRLIKENEVLESIVYSACVSNGIPKFDLVLNRYRLTTSQPSLPAQNLRRKISGYGFLWILLA